MKQDNSFSLDDLNPTVISVFSTVCKLYRCILHINTTLTLFKYTASKTYVMSSASSSSLFFFRVKATLESTEVRASLILIHNHSDSAISGAASLFFYQRIVYSPTTQ